MRLKHLFSALEKVLLGEGETAALAGILLDRGVISQVPTTLQAIVGHFSL